MTILIYNKSDECIHKSEIHQFDTELEFSDDGQVTLLTLLDYFIYDVSEISKIKFLEEQKQ